MTHEVIVTTESGQQIRGLVEYIILDAGITKLEIRGCHLKEVRMDDAYQPSHWPDFWIGFFIAALLAVGIFCAFTKIKPTQRANETPSGSPRPASKQVPEIQLFEECVGRISCDRSTDA